jgi:hypothetical protein
LDTLSLRPLVTQIFAPSKAYEQQDERLKRRFPLAKPLSNQAALKLEFANGSRLIGIPEGADQIRSYHPWGLLMDEAAFQPEAGEAYDDAVPVCQKRTL